MTAPTEDAVGHTSYHGISMREEIPVRTIRWTTLSTFLCEVALEENGQTVGRLHQPTNFEPVFWGEFEELATRIEKVDDSHALYRAGFADGKPGSLATVHYAEPRWHRVLFSSSIPRPPSIRIDGSRNYEVLSESTWRGLWFSGETPAMAFEADGLLAKDRSGLIKIQPNVLDLDLPVLVLLGTLLAVGGELFTRSDSTRY